MRSDEIKNGWFVVIQYKTGKTATERKNEVRTRVEMVSKKKNVDLRYWMIDAIPKASASNL